MNRLNLSQESVNLAKQELQHVMCIVPAKYHSDSQYTNITNIKKSDPANSHLDF